MNIRVCLTTTFVFIVTLILLVHLNDIDYEHIVSNSFMLNGDRDIHGKRASNDIYLKTLTVVLTGYAFKSAPLKMGAGDQAVLDSKMNNDSRKNGWDWPSVGYTMIGVIGLENIQQILEKVIQDRVAGDFLEAGVWRGGASMFAKAVMRVGRFIRGENP